MRVKYLDVHLFLKRDIVLRNMGGLKMCQETKKFTQGVRHKPVSNKKKLKEQTDYQLAKAKEEATVNQMQANPGGYR